MRKARKAPIDESRWGFFIALYSRIAGMTNLDKYLKYHLRNMHFGLTSLHVSNPHFF